MGTILKKRVKNILFVTVGYTLGGSEMMIERLSLKLRERGYNIRILAFKGKGPISDILESKGFECDSLHGKSKYDFKIIFRYFRYLKENRPDIIIAFLYRAYILTRIFSWILSIPNVSSVRDVQKWMNPVQILIDRLTEPFCSVVYACSKGVYRFIVEKIKIPPDRVITIPNGIDTDIFNVTVDKEKKLSSLGIDSKLTTLGTVCRLHEPKKGIKYLLDAAKMLQKSVDFNLVIIGGGKDELELKDYASKKDINVTFLGEREDVSELLRVMDVFVLPSLYEGFPVTILEAMASELPVVATNVGGIPEVVIDSETGYLVDAADVESLCNRIYELIINEEKRIKFGEKGYKRVRDEFSIDRTVDGIENIWKG